MIHPNTELRLINQAVGHGVFATRKIPMGTMTYVKDDMELIFKAGDPRLLDKKYFDIIERYSYINNLGQRIVSWDLSKYVNHSCNPNTISTGYDFEITLRDIEEGEQITDEYGIFNLLFDMTCQCGEPGCRGIIRQSDFDHLYKQWDRQIRIALTHFSSIDQPLIEYLDPKTKNQLYKYLIGGKPYRSVHNLQLRKSLRNVVMQPFLISQTGQQPGNGLFH